MGQEDNVTIEHIANIFLNNTPQYDTIKKIAGNDIEKELLDRIDKFLESRHEDSAQEEIKKVVFDDASKVSDRNINDIVDAFIRMRSQNTLSEVDKKSINDIMILFNQWMAIGKSQQDISMANNLITDAHVFTNRQGTQNSLEEQITAFRSSLPAMGELYKVNVPRNAQAGELYSGQRPGVYDLNSNSEFVHGEHCDHDHGYSGKALYKDHQREI